MRRLAVAVPLALALAPLTAAPAAAASPRFAVTVTAMLRTEWQTVDSWVRDDGCRFTQSVSGWTNVAVRTRRRTVATLRRGRLDVRVPLTGAVSGNGGSGGVETDPCHETSVVDGRSLGGTLGNEARVSVDGGVVAIAGPPAWVAAVPWAPSAFGQSAAPRLELAPGRLPTAALRERRRARLATTGRYDTVVRLRGDLNGDLVEKVRWTLSLRRLRPAR